MARNTNLAVIADEYPHRNSPLSLTLDGEIKRLANERGESIEQIQKGIAAFLSISTRQVYNYRMGKTLIPETQILKFCKQFNSLALATVWLCEESEEGLPDDFDFVRFANESARTVLQTHDKYLEAFEDKKINGFELTELKKSTAKSKACLNRLEFIAEANYQRRAA
jgi:hypothetical protein